MIAQLVKQFENLSPFREEPGKVPLAISLRNACYDTIFYDTLALTNFEKGQLLAKAFSYDEGGMLYVYPAADNQPIEYFSLSHDLVEAHPELDTVAIPGVGSSVIGSASVARQVANVVGRPVVGIIAGYGAADMMSEALGGWFNFGARNRARSMIAEWRRRLTPSVAEETVQAEAKSRAQEEKYKIKSSVFLVDEPESNTLLNIMLRCEDGLRLLVGHSKGALNIHNVLHAYLKEPDHNLNSPLFQNMAIVTLGCGVEVPPEFENVHQYLGSWDLLGAINTPPEKGPSMQSIDHKGHNLCSWNLLHMPVEELLPQDDSR